MVGRIAAMLAALGLLSFGSTPAMGAPADLDRSFGSYGIVRGEGPLGRVFPREGVARMAIGPADEIFVLYSQAERCASPFECEADISVLRYDRDGNRDPSFGTGPGSVLTVPATALYFQHSFDLAVGPDGKPVVTTSGLVARFDQAGHLDGAFGAGGKVPMELDREAVVAVQDDGGIVVAGEGGREDGGSRLRLFRYLPNGELDVGFGSGGEAAVTVPTRSRPEGVMLGGNGSIAVATPQCCGGSVQFGNGFSLARFLPDGQADPTLAGSGLFFLPTAEAQGTVEAAAAGSDGSTFISFEEETAARSTVGNVVKIRPDGALDPDFGSQGRTWLGRAGVTSPDDLTVDAKGRLVGVSGSGDVSVFRVRPDGGLDRTFNGGQSVSVAIGKAREIGVSLGLQSSGRIVALGESDCCSQRKLFGLAAFRGGTDRSRCLGRKATIVGTRKADELTGTPRRDVIAALGGKDKVRGLSGPDVICGGKGQDSLLGGPGRDEVRQ